LAVVLALIAFNYRPPLGIIYLWDDPQGNLQIVLGPGIVLGLSTAAYIARMARTTLLEVIRDDYIRTARAKGLAERIVVLRHALHNALLPVITLSGVLFGLLLGGSVAVELAFAVPGLGTALVQAFTERDFVVVQNLVLLYGLIFVLVNLLIDVAYAWLDPRIKYS
jgi:peptide/nickel transport system permease protein